MNVPMKTLTTVRKIERLNRLPFELRAHPVTGTDTRLLYSDNFEGTIPTVAKLFAVNLRNFMRWREDKIFYK